MIGRRKKIKSCCPKAGFCNEWKFYELRMENFGRFYFIEMTSLDFSPKQ